jgi:broad specificity phosphatase PhoE
MNPAVLWMRHGTSNDGLCHPRAHPHPGSPLSIAGAVETQLTARYLCSQRWQPALVGSSPLRRARQTAVIVTDTLATRLAEPQGAFAEWRAPDCVLGRSPNQYPPEYVAWREQRARHPDSALLGGESLHVFAERAARATATAHDLAAEHGPLLIVSHKLLIGAVAGLHRGYRHPADIFSHASGFRLAPASLWAAPPRETT